MSNAVTSDLGNRTVKAVVTIGDKTTVEYSDGTTRIYCHYNEEVKTESSVNYNANLVKSTSGDKTMNSNFTNSYQSGSLSGVATNSSNYHGQSSGYYTTSSVSPTLAYQALNIEFWGTAKHNLDEFLFKKGDLIINCTGTPWVPKPPVPPKDFTMKKPAWLNIPEIPLSILKPSNNPELAEQIVFDWADMKPPPESADLSFWEEILSQAIDNKIKRIICCCLAGQGRTGTVLASLLLATGEVDEPDVAIDYIRDSYSKKAIETKGQEEYIFGLIYQEFKPTKPTKTNKTNKVNKLI